MISKFLFNFSNFCVIYFLTKLITLGILFSTAVTSVFVAKLQTPKILFSNSVSFGFQQNHSHQEFFFLILFCQFDIWFLKQNDQYQYCLLLKPVCHKQFFQQHHFLLDYLICSNQQELVLICQCLIYQLQFLDQLNLFVVQNLKYQRMLHFLDQFLLHRWKDQL